MNGECQKKNREIILLTEERDHLIARVDDTRRLLAEMSELKEDASNLVKSHIVRADVMQKEIEQLKEDVRCKNETEAKVKQLILALEAAHQKIADTEEDDIPELPDVPTFMPTQQHFSEQLQSESNRRMSNLRRGLSVEDTAIADRLEKLKKERKAPMQVPVYAEMEERPSKLKDRPKLTNSTKDTEKDQRNLLLKI